MNNEAREQLVLQVKEAAAALEKLKERLENFDSLVENNVFDSIEEAEDALTERFYNVASEACEGSYCFGEREYTQEFVVDEERWMFRLEVEYNRHDKQYYYVDGCKSSVTKL